MRKRRENLGDVKLLVEEALRQYDNARNDDIWLMIQVWRKQGLIMYIPYNKIPTLYKPETISRIRRTIQNEEHRLLPSRETRLQRGLREVDFHKFAT